MAVAPLNKFLTSCCSSFSWNYNSIYHTNRCFGNCIVCHSCQCRYRNYLSKSNFYASKEKVLLHKHLENTRNIRVIKEAEIPPNDSLVVIDGRLVLERTALISDSIVVSGVQSGIVTVSKRSI